MLIEFKSTNPNFISLLFKNPNSFNGLQLKEIKNGVGIGIIKSDSEYHLIFQDTKYSFTNNDKSNLIDFQSYASPKVVLALISDFLKHFLKSKAEYFEEKIPWLNSVCGLVDCDGFENSIEIENLYIDFLSDTKKFVFQQYFPEIKLIHKIGNLYSLKIKSNKSLFYLINLTMIMCMYIATNNFDGLFLTKELVLKYIKIIKNIDNIPYFIVYIFIKRCIPTETMFNELIPELDKIFNKEVEFHWGNSQEMRIRAIKNRLIINDQINNHVIEVGCGEMNYPNLFLGKLISDKKWYAVDTNNMFAYMSERINKKYKTQQLEFSTNGFSFSEFGSITLLFIEVIEHMPYEEAVKMVVEYLKYYKPKKVLITTPNFDFNVNYALNGFRHNDHHFELNKEQFRNFILQVLNEVDGNYMIDEFQIGDVVKNQSLSLGIELHKMPCDN